jgi:hypothetical protein
MGIFLQLRQFTSEINLKNIVNVMKLSVLLSFVALLCTSAASGYSQDTQITLHLKNATIEDVLEAIKHQTEYSF